MSRRGQHIVVGLDIGTTKICAIIGDVKSNSTIDVIGVGTHPSRGLKKGVVINIDSTVESIRQAMRSPDHGWGRGGSVYVGISVDTSWPQQPVSSPGKRWKSPPGK
jgi:cell division protein FtsA